MAKRIAQAAGRTSRPSRFEKLTDEEVAQRWREAVPRFGRWIALFGAGVVLLFIYNWVFKPDQTITNIINVAFQISAIFLVCFSMMLAMGLWYGRETKRR